MKREKMWKPHSLLMVAAVMATPGGAGTAKTIRIAVDGSGDYKMLAQAIAAVEDNSSKETIIHLGEGRYVGPNVIPNTKSNITLEGEGIGKSILTHLYNTNEPNPPGVDRFHKGTGLVVNASDFHAHDLTFENASGDHGQALALRIDGDRAVVWNCQLIGWQDTLMVRKGRMYFKNCYIAGRVDFIYGDATAWFENCEIHSHNGGFVTAARTPEKQPFGFIFNHCALTGDSIACDPATTNPATTDKANHSQLAALGRPWRPFASVTYLHCELGSHIRPEGWDNWGNAANEKTAHYAEYKNTGPSAAADKRVAWSKQLNDEEAAGDVYSVEKGYGYDLGSSVAGRPWFFSMKAGPGEYRATVTFGGGAGERDDCEGGDAAVDAGVHTGPGETVTRSFLTHVRVPEITGGGVVSLKAREKDPILFVQWDDKTQVEFKELDWDEKLTLEFSGATAAVRTVAVESIPHQTTIYLAGDSTMTDQMMEPWAALGQMLPRWINEMAVVANYAESGETAASFISEKRWAKVLSEAQAGDYVLMQFGINDQRGGVERFKAGLTKMVEEAKGERVGTGAGDVAELEEAGCGGKRIEHARGVSTGDAGSGKGERHRVDRFECDEPDIVWGSRRGEAGKAFVDGTHQTDYGAYELAKCVVSGMGALPFKPYVVEEWKGFDPSKPDALEDFALPMDHSWIRRGRAGRGHRMVRGRWRRRGRFGAQRASQRRRARDFSP